MYTIAPEFTAWTEECQQIIATYPHFLQRVAKGIELPANPFAYRHGVEAQSTVYVDGRRYFTVDAHPCGRCGGKGNADQWKHTGYTCYECNGSGFLGRTRNVTVYTADVLAKLDAKAQAKAQAKFNAEQAKLAAFEAQHADLFAKFASVKNPNDFVVDVITKGRKYGSLSDAQVAAVTKALDASIARQAALQASSEHVGTVGSRTDFELTLTFYTSFDGTFGTTHIHGFKDATGNVFIYKGSKRLDVAKGEQIKFKATIKEHGERDGVKQTILARPV